MVRVQLPFHLQNLAGLSDEVQIEVSEPVCVDSIVDSLETCFPTLKGSILEHETRKRRPKVRFLTCGKDVSLDSLTEPLPDAVAKGTEPFMIIGAISGG